jgi:hypothetical protein
VAIETAGKVELEKRHLDPAGRYAGEADDLVHRHWRGT